MGQSPSPWQPANRKSPPHPGPFQERQRTAAVQNLSGNAKRPGVRQSSAAFCPAFEIYPVRALQQHQLPSVPLLLPTSCGELLKRFQLSINHRAFKKMRPPVELRFQPRDKFIRCLPQEIAQRRHYSNRRLAAMNVRAVAKIPPHPPGRQLTHRSRRIHRQPQQTCQRPAQGMRPAAQRPESLPACFRHIRYSQFEPLIQLPPDQKSCCRGETPARLNRGFKVRSNFASCFSAAISLAQN